MRTLLQVAKVSVLPVVAALLCGYGFTWGLSALGIAALVFAGVEFHAADLTMMLIGFPVMLTVFFWCFVSHPRWLWGACVLLAGILMAIAGSLLQSRMMV